MNNSYIVYQIFAVLIYIPCLWYCRWARYDFVLICFWHIEQVIKASFSWHWWFFTKTCPHCSHIWGVGPPLALLDFLTFLERKKGLDSVLKIKIEYRYLYDNISLIHKFANFCVQSLLYSYWQLTKNKLNLEKLKCQVEIVLDDFRKIEFEHEFCRQ